MRKSKIWHFSDTHTFESMLEIPKDIDIAIFSGDCSNPRNLEKNEKEVIQFLDWYGSLDIEYKIFVAGNHDTSIEANRVRLEDFNNRGIIYLQDELACINNLNIYGSPWTPTFGEGWSFNCHRAKIYKYWEQIPDNTDIFIGHGPPKGVLDLSYDREGNLEFCGDLALNKRIRQIEPKLVCFGHIHNCDNINNQGYVRYSDHSTIYSNGSIVTDGRFGRINNNGNIFEI